MVQRTKTGKNIPNNLKYTKRQQNISNGREIDQMAIKYMYQRDPLKFTQIRIFGLKIWQP
jgi:hypothetical protein